MDQYGAATGERNAQVPAQDRPCANTSKAAVLGFTRTLADKWGLHAITVYAICPGFFPTAMAGPAITMAGGLEGANDRAPLGRLGDEEDLKGITLLRASDAGTHVTGQALAVDGGVSVARGLNSTPTEISL